jgi:pimeloyl-ACP methyl ester carboxylesterase
MTVVAGSGLRSIGWAVAEASSGVVHAAGDVHAAVTRRVSAALPRPARRVAEAQGALATAVYRTVAAALRLVPVAVTKVAEASVPAGGHAAVTRSSTGQAALCALNGLWGDHFAARHEGLAVRAAVRSGCADVAVETRAVAAAFPGATPRLAVFLHGLAESESVWRRGGRPTYGDLLRDGGVTPVYVRYNSGLTLAANGAVVSELLERLVETWPVRVEEIHLVGHSMGGLVVGTACHRARLDDRAWLPAVRTVVTLGTPHLGAPLAKAVWLAEGLLSRFPEAQPLARVLAARSVGIQGLRAGLELPVLPHATYRLVAATVTRDPRHPAAVLLGDGLVGVTSAWHQGRTGWTAGVGAQIHLGDAHHFSLLNHPEVGRLLRAWLSPRSQLLPVSCAPPPPRHTRGTSGPPHAGPVECTRNRP